MSYLDQESNEIVDDKDQVVYRFPGTPGRHLEATETDMGRTRYRARQPTKIHHAKHGGIVVQYERSNILLNNLKERTGTTIGIDCRQLHLPSRFLQRSTSQMTCLQRHMKVGHTYFDKLISAPPPPPPLSPTPKH